MFCHGPHASIHAHAHPLTADQIRLITNFASVWRIGTSFHLRVDTAEECGRWGGSNADVASWFLFKNSRRHTALNRSMDIQPCYDQRVRISSDVRMLNSSLGSSDTHSYTRAHMAHPLWAMCHLEQAVPEVSFPVLSFID